MEILWPHMRLEEMRRKLPPFDPYGQCSSKIGENDKGEEKLRSK